MSSEQLTAVLTSAQSADAATRKAAEEQLLAFEAQNFDAFMGLLASELGNEAKPPATRRLAGLMLKNAVFSDDCVRAAEKSAKWAAVAEGAKAQIRACLLSTLNSEVKEARHTAAQAVGKVGALDLAAKRWPDLVPALQGNVASPSAGVKQATLEALGYVCEDLDPSALEQAQVNVVLTAVVAGMRKEEEPATREVATKALDNALVFAKKNFETDGERNYLMQMLCEGAQAPELQVRAASMECLADIAYFYYKFLAPYMKTIFDLTAAAFADAHNNEDVAIKALDFWGNVCDQELDEAEEGHSFQFAQAAAPTLVPHLLRMLPSRVATEEELDEDTWDLSRAAGLCLQVLTRAVGDSVLDAVLPFVQQHVTSQDWRAREAAVTAFGAVVDGPAHAKIVPVAQGALASLLAVLKDPSLPVRRSAAYCLGIIFEQLHVPGDPLQPTIVPPEGLAPVLTALLGCITTDDAAVADSAIWTLAQLVQGYAEAAHVDPDSPSPLTPFFGGLVEALLHAAERPDAVKLRGDAYTTLCDTVDAASAAEAPLLLQLIPHLLAKLAATWENAPAVLSPEGVEAQAELQGHLCGVLMQATTRLSKSGAAAEQLSGLADSMMMAYLRVFACRPNTVHGEAVMAVGALVDALGEKFVKYMTALYPIVELGLKNYAEASVCANAVMLVGDLSRELGSAIMPWADNLMLLLLQDLSSDHISKDVKPHIISAFGDMALAIGPSFDRFLPHVAGMLVSAAQHSNVVAKGLVQSGDDEDIEEARDYNNLLRASILEAYTGILQGLKDDPVKTEQLLKPQAASVAEFIATCFADGTADDGVLVAAVGALGDLASLDGLAPMLANKAELMALLQHCLAMEDGAVKDAALFTQAVIFAQR